MCAPSVLFLALETATFFHALSDLKPKALSDVLSWLWPPEVQVYRPELNPFFFWFKSFD
jgi:hypothetical protein